MTYFRMLSLQSTRAARERAKQNFTAFAATCFRKKAIEEAENEFCRAVEIARAQKARSWELRAATSLAQLYADRGHRAQALEVLSPVYSWFAENFDTADLRAARTLLQTLELDAGVG